MDTLYSMEKLTQDKINDLRNEGLAQQGHHPRGKNNPEIGGLIRRILSWFSGKTAEKRESRLAIR